MDPQKIVSSPACGIRCKPRYSENCACPDTYVSTVSAAAAINVHPIASPSNPSVRFTAFVEPTNTSATNNTNGTNAKNARCGMCSQESTTRFGCSHFVNG